MLLVTHLGLENNPSHENVCNLYVSHFVFYFWHIVSLLFSCLQSTNISNLMQVILAFGMENTFGLFREDYRTFMLEQNVATCACSFLGFFLWNGEELYFVTH